MGCKRRESIPSEEMVFSKFKPFVNGLYNCHLPKDYNSLLGYPVAPLRRPDKPLNGDIRLPTAKINGQHISI